MQRFLAALFVIGFSATIASFAHADGALAIGIPGGDLNKGFVYGYTWNDELDNSQKRAMDLCKGIDLTNNRVPDRASDAQASCKLMRAFRNQCVAISMNGDQHTPATGVGWSVATTSDAAKSQAQDDCTKMRNGRGPACQVDGEGCDGDAK